MNDSFQDIINSEKPVLLDFYATWCGPCQMLGPILKNVKDSIGDRVTIIKIDVDKNPEVASIYQIRSVPTLIMFKKGKPVWKQSGVVPTQELIKLFNQFQ